MVILLQRLGFALLLAGLVISISMFVQYAVAAPVASTYFVGFTVAAVFCFYTAVLLDNLQDIKSLLAKILAVQSGGRAEEDDGAADKQG